MSTRRGILLGAGVIALAGCSTRAVPFDATEAGSSNPADAVPTPSASPKPIGTAATGATGAPAESAAGTVLAAATEIPVGGGKVFAAEKVVVTQPRAGSYRAFSAVCTHVGCLVNEIANGTIDCPCHGSEFRITDGAVVTGPAPSPLPKRNIKIEAGQVVLL